MKLKGVIFDCDGVLVDSEKLAVKALLLLAKPHGYSISLSRAVELFHGKSYQYCFDTIRAGAKHPLPDNYEEEYRRLSFEFFKRELKPMDGVEDFIKRLKVPYCVASSGPRDKIKFNLDLAGFGEKFKDETIFSCYDIRKWKPEPDIFIHAAKTMNFHVKECVVIEDSPTGVEAAVRGGFKVFGFANKKTADDLQNAGATVFFNFRELYRKLDLLNDEKA